MAEISSQTEDYCKSKMQDPFYRAHSTVSKSEACPFQYKIAAIIIKLYVSVRVIVAMLQHCYPLKTLKQMEIF